LGGFLSSSLPHRQLRKLRKQLRQLLRRSLPHRQLRNFPMEMTAAVLMFAAA